MRRLLSGTTAFVALTGAVLVLPVYAEPTPEAVPVETSVEEVSLGSIEQPAAEADVQQGTTEPVAGVSETAPALTVRRTGLAEFSLVGVTWAFDTAVTDTLVQVRVQDAAGTWGEWTEVGAETADQGASEARTGAELRGGTSPLWTGPSTGVEACSSSTGAWCPSFCRVAAIAAARARGEPSLILIATPVPSGSPTA